VLFFLGVEKETSHSDATKTTKETETTTILFLSFFPVGSIGRIRVRLNFASTNTAN